MQVLYVYTTRNGAAAWNMAVDEALLRCSPDVRQPVLRFYSWKEPAATFGYFQRYAEVEALTPLRPLIRRPTGGGIVPHDCDWTYSMAFPASHPWYDLKAEESYRQVHEWIQCAFSRFDIRTSLAPCCLSTGPGQCFAGYEKHDLLYRGRKIAGAAQRRTREGLLIQGSVQAPEPAVAREQWEEGMTSCAHSLFGFHCSPHPVSSTFDTVAANLENTRYGRSDYNRKR